MFNYFLFNVIFFLVLWFMSYLFAKREMKTGKEASQENLALLGLGWIVWIISCIIWAILIIIL